jgi:hypothetical protein
MSKKVVNKKVILTAGFTGLTQDEILKRETDMAKAQVLNPTLVPGLTPTAASVQTQITAINDPNTGLIHQLGVVRAQEKSLVGQIDAAINDIKDIITDDWMPQTQTAIAGDVTKAATLLFGVKGFSTGHASTTVASTAKTVASAPVVVKIDVIAGEQVLHIHNNITGKRGRPKGVKQIDVYAQTGGTAPTNLASLIANGGGYIGQAKDGKFVNTIAVTAANVGKIEYYIVVYVDSKTLKPSAYSTVAFETIK